MSVTWTGMDEYQAELTAWPQQAAGEAAQQVERAAEAAYETIRAGYTVITGHLRDGLQRADVTTDAMHPKWRVWNDVIYARVWESGGNTTAGVHTPGKNFVPTMQRQRRALTAELVEVVKTGAETVTVNE